jgi:hypothetical protein
VILFATVIHGCVVRGLAGRSGTGRVCGNVGG